ncbi:MAG: ABC transporter family substrate-binding protein [Gaiellaceae bacterium]
MERLPARRRYPALALVIGAIVALGIGAASSPAAAPTTIVFGAEQEPPCLNGVLAGCNNTWTSWTVGVAFPGAYRQKPDFTWEPYMLDGEAKIVSRSPFTLLYKIKQNAVWSDGRPITADDFIFTATTTLNPRNDVAARTGFDQMKRLVKVNAKTLRVVFKQPFAAYKQIWSGAFGVLPKHALQGRDFNTIWNTNVNNPANGQRIGSGPYLVSDYQRGQSLTMVRNPRWWGKRPAVDRIVFRFITNTDSEIQAMRGGEVDAIYPQPQLQLASLSRQSGLKVESNFGSTLEHLDFNTGARGFSLARAPWFRQAVAYSIDRGALVRQLFRTLNPKLGPLQNLTYVNNQKEYAPSFGQYTLNRAKVDSIMRAHNCSKGSDGIYVCGGVKASLRIGTTAGNRLRELSLELIQAQAKSAGIELRIDNSPSRIFFPAVSDENYHIALFAWVGTGDPAGQVDIYGCGGGSNWKAYCSRKVTNLFRQSDAELDAAKRRSLVLQADRIMAANLPTIPLFQKPTYFVYKSKLRGMRDNPTSAGPTWNIEDWRVGGDT